MLWLPVLACSGPDGAGGAHLLSLFEDRDGDGYGTGEARLFDSVVTGWVSIDGDCDDDDPTVHPGATDACVQGYPKDLDCDGVAMVGGADEFFVAGAWVDGDGDGFGGEFVSWFYCHGTPPNVDLTVNQGGDCDDADPTTYPGAPELCDGVDNDCDDVPDEGC